MRAWLGLLVLSACSHAGAIERAQTDVLRNPTDVQGWIDLGDAYRKDGQDDSAAQAYGNALRLDPDNDALRDRVGSRASSGAARALELQVLADPDNDELWGDLGDAYAEMGDRVTALRHYQYALSLDPDDSEWQRKVIEFMPQGDVDAMQQALANSNDDEAIGDLADRSVRLMSTLNTPGAALAKAGLVKGGTDVTGFGLLGHLGSMARESGVTAILHSGQVPAIDPRVLELIEEGCVPGGTRANLKAATTSSFAESVPDSMRLLLADAQTSGGLLLAVPPANLEQVLAVLEEEDAPCAEVIGEITGQGVNAIEVH